MHKFEELKNYLHSNFVELDHAIRAILLGLTAKAHVFLLGPPGTAKSHLAEVLCDALELKAFRFLFTDETKHKDIFGIQSIQALKEDKDVLITEGKLTQSIRTKRRPSTEGPNKGDRGTLEISGRREGFE